MKGKILSCIGGLYTVSAGSNKYLCNAKGRFRHEDICPMPGDNVEFTIGIGSEASERRNGINTRAENGCITEIADRRNKLPRPPLANIDTLFIVCSVTDPQPSLLSIDKLTVIAENLNIKPIIVFSKTDLDKEKANELKELYLRCGFDVICVSPNERERLCDTFYPLLKNKTSAFEGPSGVGKTTLMNSLFPSLGLTTGEISTKNRRGKNTTRDSIIYCLCECSPYFADTESYLADTPGFTCLDFEKYPFLDKSELAYAFPEFFEHIGSCKYTKCTHLSEEGCKIVEAVENGNIPKTRHDSYVYLYRAIQKYNPYKH